MVTEPPRKPRRGPPGGGDDDGDDSPRGQSRRSPSPPAAPVRVREAESIKVAAFPEPPSVPQFEVCLSAGGCGGGGAPR